MSDVTDLLDRLAAGDTTVAEVGRVFAARRWPTVRPAAGGYAALAAREDGDPEPIAPGSWAEVEAAFVNGVISADQYEALFAARAQSSR
uniref:hypothetical protein n=1 Tax=Nonomuraea sp. CA-251285 TaxID=3240002 RepID=UPI003F492DAD